jgi:hypothetical protein
VLEAVEGTGRAFNDMMRGAKKVWHRAFYFIHDPAKM